MNNQRKDTTMATEQIQETEAQQDHGHALALAAQAIVDTAVYLSEFGTWEEWQHVATVKLGRMEDLQNAIDEWRSLGGRTTEEAAS